MKAILLASMLFLLAAGGVWAQIEAAPGPEETPSDIQTQEVDAQPLPSELYEMIDSNATLKTILNDEFPDMQAQLSYAIGMNIAERFQRELEYEIIEDSFLEAVNHVYKGEPQLVSKQEALDTLKEWQTKRRKAKVEERTRVKTPNELDFHILKASNGFPQQIANSTLVLEADLMDDLIKMDADSYGFTVEKFFYTIEWGMQGAIVNATWKELADNKWEVTVGTLYRGADPHTDILHMDYKPEANETSFTSYTVDGESREGPALREAYENVLRLYQKQ